MPIGSTERDLLSLSLLIPFYLLPSFLPSPTCVESLSSKTTFLHLPFGRGEEEEEEEGGDKQRCCVLT